MKITIGTYTVDLVNNKVTTEDFEVEMAITSTEAGFVRVLIESEVGLTAHAILSRIFDYTALNVNKIHQVYERLCRLMPGFNEIFVKSGNMYQFTSTIKEVEQQ